MTPRSFQLLLLPLVWTAVPCWPAQPDPPPKTVRQLWDEGARLYRQGDLFAALDVWDEALSHEPGNLPILEKWVTVRGELVSGPLLTLFRDSKGPLDRCLEARQGLRTLRSPEAEDWDLEEHNTTWVLAMALAARGRMDARTLATRAGEMWDKDATNQVALALNLYMTQLVHFAEYVYASGWADPHGGAIADSVIKRRDEYAEQLVPLAAMIDTAIATQAAADRLRLDEAKRTGTNRVP